ncbi:MAG: hypothetical protein Q8R24_10185 [Legionellaceae bacterium]|nr:hypothetical protein [Legionellaceae bacterium]
MNSTHLVQPIQLGKYKSFCKIFRNEISTSSALSIFSDEQIRRHIADLCACLFHEEIKALR